eukprot:TRINITY_DN2238_c0_g1_i1.p1 TRINITY_DN2238_c0_g1~~TRINITY_DN2238_c0_g1_i1.p1  ORF type:complete len:767 (-),score=215.63 TRINITY_DN2238_c0_g1_i1:41-2341(-)
MSGKVKSAETEKGKPKDKTPKESKENKGDLKKSKDEKKSKKERHTVDSSEAETVIEATLSLSGSGGENSAWKRIRPRTVVKSGTVSSASERSSSSSDLSNAVSNLLWPEEKTRGEALCIEASRIDWKLRILSERTNSYCEDQKKLLDQRAEQQLKREKLVEQLKQLEDRENQEKFTKIQTEYGNLINALLQTNSVIKTKADELRPKDGESLPNPDDIIILSQLVKLLEPIVSCPPVQEYYNTVIQKEIQDLKDFNEDLEKKIQKMEESSKSLDFGQTITTLLTSVEQIREPIQAIDYDQIYPFFAPIENSSRALIEKVTSSPLKDGNLLLDPTQELYLVAVPNPENTNEDADNSDIRFSEKKEGDQYPQIKAGTVNKLVERLTFQKYPDMAFQKAFLLTYRSFMTPMDLMEKLILRFCISPAGDPTHTELEFFRKTVQTPVQLRVVNVLRNWLENFWRDFDDDVKKSFLSAVDNVVNYVNPKLGSNLLQAFQKKEQNSLSKTIQHVQKPPPAPKLPKNIDGPLTFDDLDATELARQLTLLEHRLYKAIQPKELLHQAWSKKDKETRSPNVLSMIRMFNKISNWVCSEIVGTSDLPSRATKLGKFIQIAKECYQFNNFNGTLEIVAALGNSAVFRLKKTWEEESVKKSLEDLEAMKQLMELNYRKFREELHNANPPCIPYIGIFLTDLTFTEDGMPNTLEGKLINFAKLRQVAEKIQEIQQYQNDSYNFTEIAQIQKYLNDIQEADDDTLYKQSQKIESKKLNKFFG